MSGFSIFSPGRIFGPPAATHVANASAFDIYVRVETDASVLKKVEVEIEEKIRASGKVGIEYHIEICEKNGFTKIMPQNYLKFITRYSELMAYVTIYYFRNSQRISIAECFPIEINKSVIVDKNTQIRRTKMGTIWTDESGKDHKGFQ